MSIDKNYIIEAKNWNELIRLAHPDGNLYVEPSHDISHAKTVQNNNIETLAFFKDLLTEEKEYLKANIDKVTKFTNKFQSYISNNDEVTIIDLAYEFLLPVAFVKGYFDVLKDKGFISLVYRNLLK